MQWFLYNRIHRLPNFPTIYKLVYSVRVYVYKLQNIPILRSW